MSETVANLIRRGLYLDSVALMRVAHELEARPGIAAAALLIGTEANKSILANADLLRDEGRGSSANDLVVAVRGEADAVAAALAAAEAALERPNSRSTGAAALRPRSIASARSVLPGANLALISVPGAFAAYEARRALAQGLHVMLFSDNVPLADEIALKRDAAARGLALMGPDCGTAAIAGVPLGFANAVPRGPIGIISASGTGAQEIASLIARRGSGISHILGVGGRDLSAEVAGMMTFAAIDALEADDATARIVIVSKPPDIAVMRRVAERVRGSAKRFVLCFIGATLEQLPEGGLFAPTLKAAAEAALGHPLDQPVLPLPALPPERRWIRGLFCGGTLCAEAQSILVGAGEQVTSNVPVSGAAKNGSAESHTLIDLGADEYTLGKPHPMLEPSLRRPAVAAALADPTAAVVLVDVVIGHGAHADPASELVAGIRGSGGLDRPAIVASVCGTEADPQVYSRQVEILERAGVLVLPSNADAALFAARIVTRRRP
jgi:FdrA protein